MNFNLLSPLDFWKSRNIKVLRHNVKKVPEKYISTLRCTRREERSGTNRCELQNVAVTLDSADLAGPAGPGLSSNHQNT